ncbi:MAG: hypothetical protein ACYC3S_09790 [Chloroflexota bacterium]
MTTKSLVDQVIEWALGRPEFAGFKPERNVKIRGQKKDIFYGADILLVKSGRLGWLFHSGPFSGTAAAVTVGRGSAPMTDRDVMGIQKMAADVFQAVFKSKEPRPIQLWVHITTQPYDDNARMLAGQMRLVWFGHIDGEGNVEQVL